MSVFGVNALLDQSIIHTHNCLYGGKIELLGFLLQNGKGSKLENAMEQLLGNPFKKASQIVNFTTFLH